MLVRLIALLCLISSAAHAADIASSVDAAALSEKKRTTAGLYLTPQDAYKALQADPGVVFIDVRDPIEFSFIGHAEGVDANVPFFTASHKYSEKDGRYEMVKNASFLAEAEAAIWREDGDEMTPIFVMCRSGTRSARAADVLIEAGYKNVWNIIEGFEGDKDKATGVRSLNGWRNAGLPWSYKIPPEVAWSGL